VKQVFITGGSGFIGRGVEEICLAPANRLLAEFDGELAPVQQAQAMHRK
jgi:hypothetical protein